MLNSETVKKRRKKLNENGNLTILTATPTKREDVLSDYKKLLDTLKLPDPVEPTSGVLFIVLNAAPASLNGFRPSGSVHCRSTYNCKV